jgi:hypothetical protein
VPKSVFKEGKDYCDGERERWIWSIGQRKSDGTIFASWLHSEKTCDGQLIHDYQEHFRK